MAIGQFLESTPPYLPMGGTTFFMQACRIGDAAGCERFEQIKAMAPRPCRDDLLACAWRVTRIEDPALSEEACSLGIADGCLRMAWFTRDDAARSRRYIEASCQLGWASSCADVARALKPGCTPTEHAPCWPPDPATSKIAAEMACAAGWGDEALCGVP